MKLMLESFQETTYILHDIKCRKCLCFNFKKLSVTDISALSITDFLT